MRKRCKGHWIFPTKDVHAENKSDFGDYSLKWHKLQQNVPQRNQNAQNGQHCLIEGQNE